MTRPLLFGHIYWNALENIGFPVSKRTFDPSLACPKTGVKVTEVALGCIVKMIRRIRLASSPGTLPERPPRPGPRSPFTHNGKIGESIEGFYPSLPHSHLFRTATTCCWETFVLLRYFALFFGDIPGRYEGTIAFAPVAGLWQLRIQPPGYVSIATDTVPSRAAFSLAGTSDLKIWLLSVARRFRMPCQSRNMEGCSMHIERAVGAPNEINDFVDSG